MKDEEYKELKREAKAARIFVRSTYSPFNSEGIPPDHKDKFCVIQELGRTSYSAYGYVPNTETTDKPWQRQNKRRAVQLVHFADKCRKENRNEAGWRNEVESKVFERFDYEVACKRCRKRLWRSEIEANPNSSNSKTVSLQDRQRKREQCKCNPAGRLGDYLDSGISELFSSRLQETVCEPGKASSQPTRSTKNKKDPKKKQPDRIHGLQRTTNFEKLLQELYAHDEPQRYPPRKIEDVVNVSINPDNGGIPLLFPFLILEAKREKDTQNFEQMEIQTAFPIRNALKLQYDLVKIRGNTMDVPGGPLVWFFASRGEDWRVYGAVVNEEEGRPNYLINYLWGGSITKIDQALQLVLIVDYILDWARDIYRPNLLRQLKTLRLSNSSNLDDAMTSILDPDVYSLAGEVQPWMEAQDIQMLQPEDILDPYSSDAASVTFEEDPVDSFGVFKSSQGLVRDARIIESRLRSLYITRDNAQTLLQDFENPNTATALVRSILAIMSRKCVVLESEEVLNAIEDKWTGNVRPRTSAPLQASKVFAQFRVSYFINHAWEQVRELTYLAVSDEAREILIERAKFRSVVRRSRFSPPECPAGQVIKTMNSFLKRSVRQDFVAALARRTFMTDMESRSVITLDDSGAAQEEISLRMVIKQDKNQKSPGVSMQDIVHRVYEKYRIGNRDPSEPFLRVSARVDCEGRPLWKDWQVGDTLPAAERHLDKQLVYGDIANTRYLPASQQKLCLYILDGQTENLDYFSVVTKLLWHLHSLLGERVYATVRKGRVHTTNKKREDNRAHYHFFLKMHHDQLKLPPDELRQNVFDWIKNISPKTPQEPFMVKLDVNQILKDSVFSREAKRKEQATK